MKRVTNKTEVLKKGLKYEISNGIYLPGDKLINEREMSKRYGVSRNTLRIALDELITQKIFERRPRQGTYVSEKALDIIGRDIEKPNLSVLLIMPTSQLSNPLVNNLFAACYEHINENVKISVMFQTINQWFLDNPPHADILVIYSNQDFTLLKKLEKKYDSLVLLNVKHDEFNYISPDNFSGGYEMAKHLFEYGHRDIGCIDFEPEIVSLDFLDRQRGVEKAFSEAGIKFNPAYFAPGQYYCLDTYCYKAVDVLRRSTPKLSAIICMSDMIAIGVMNSCLEMRISIPNDISLIGFDDQSYSQFTVPRLTTMKFPAEAIGFKLAQYINNSMSGKPEKIQEVITPILMKRDTTTINKKIDRVKKGKQKYMMVP